METRILRKNFWGYTKEGNIFEPYFQYLNSLKNNGNIYILIQKDALILFFMFAKKNKTPQPNETVTDCLMRIVWRLLEFNE